MRFRSYNRYQNPGSSLSRGMVYKNSYKVEKGQLVMMSEEIFRQINEKVEGLYRLFKIFSFPVALDQMSKIVNTPQRKILWMFSNGRLTREDLAKKTGIRPRTIADFFEDCKATGLIEEEREKGGHPKRVVDWVPRAWRKEVRTELKRRNVRQLKNKSS